MRLPFGSCLVVSCAVVAVSGGAWANGGGGGFGVNLIQDPGFEAAPESSPWQAYSLNAGSPLCDGVCNPRVGSGPRNGSRWVWFGGTVTETEVAGVEQRLRLPEGSSASLGFALEIPAATCTGYLAVYVDDALVFQATETDQANFTRYAWVELDVGPFADGNMHNVYFESSTAPGGHLSFFVDDVALTVMAPAAAVLDHLVQDFAIHDADGNGTLSGDEAADDWYDIHAAGFAVWDTDGDSEVTLDDLEKQLALLAGKGSIVCAADGETASGPGAAEFVLLLLLAAALCTSARLRTAKLPKR